ncbi:MAG TPA: Gfo/Idh/MocA family oxidoreductase [Arenibacter sp.]|nr:Gfo/Idh/MocA family oxidoreductase [Arenibacter sp.]
MGNKIRWGVLGAATIAVEQVIPAIQESDHGVLYAIASRDKAKAEHFATYFKATRAHGDYGELLRDTAVDAVYIPLPNHLHIPWAIRALEAGKHVLVEKPIGLSSEEALLLMKASQDRPDLKVMEAFMYRFHPQWARAKELIAAHVIGEVGSITSSFSFFDDNPDSITNKRDLGGGSLMDVGCYSLSLSRYIFGAEPISVSATIDYDPLTKVDLLAAGILEFTQGTSTFFSSIRLGNHQKAQIYGTKGSIEFELPFNPPIDRPSKIWVHGEDGTETINFEICNQYTLQVDAFASSVLNNTAVPTPLQDAFNNMAIIEKLEESHEKGRKIVL